jgi:hypothetical protein
LRGFRRPKNAEEIAHPSSWSRATDYAYLLLIGLFGILAGVIAFNVLPQDEMAAMAGSAMVSDADAEDILGPYLTPTQTVVLRGGETLQPTAADLELAPGEVVAFVVTNDTGDPHVFRVAGADGHDMGGTASELSPRIVIGPGETGTVVHRVGEEGVAFIWERE